MKLRFPLLTLLTVFAFAPACTGEAHDHDHGHADGGHDDHGDEDGDGHGTPHALGTLTVGDAKVEITQFGEITAGGEVAVDAMFPAGKPLPMATRAWIGIETGAGSRKGKLEKALDTKMHGHVEVPDPLPKDSRFWLEIELEDTAGGGTVHGSVALHR
ncbi:MAG: hypothetical protein KDE27_12455 [Planctomycetes bacterium]|nr:hypothetical protein [Planctomycetota bacterium]